MLLNRLLAHLPAEKFSKNFLTLLLIQSLFTIATSLSGIFVSLFLFKSTGNDFLLVAKYNMFNWLFEIVGFSLALIICKKKNPVFSMKMGLVCYTCAYLVLLIFSSNARNIYIFISLLIGTSNGFYWLGYHYLLKVFTNVGNRQQAFGFQGLISNIIGTCAPLISGFVTGTIVGFLGYIIIFFISLVTFFAATLASRLMKVVEDTDKTVYFKKAAKLARSNKTVRYMLIGEMFRGFRDSIALYYVNILVFATVANEVLVGFSLTFKSLCVIATYALIARIKNKNQRFFSVIGGVVFELSMLTVIALTLNPVVIVLYAGLHAFLLVTSYNYAQYSMFAAMECVGMTMDKEMIVFRHYTLNIGRVIAIFTFLFAPTDVIYGIYALMIIAVINILAGIYFKKCEESYFESEQQKSHT